jgi:hypothetical protein
MRWVERYTEQSNRALVLIHGPDEGPRLREWQLMGHLLKWCTGVEKVRMTPRQRLRFLAVQWATRRREFTAEADRYVEEKQRESGIRGGTTP